MIRGQVGAGDEQAVFKRPPVERDEQIELGLGNLPPYERGDHVWFKTLVENPTRWNNEGRGNDFPALYYYDPYLKAKFQMFFDMTSMSWMGPDTIKRFQGYRCGFRRLDHGHPAAEIGLLAETQGGQQFPPGAQVFSWYCSVEPSLRQTHLTAGAGRPDRPRGRLPEAGAGSGGVLAQRGHDLEGSGGRLRP